MLVLTGNLVNSIRLVAKQGFVRPYHSRVDKNLGVPYCDSVSKATQERNSRREIFGWIMYDWANHAFFTLVLGVLIAKFVTELARAAVGENGPLVSLGGYNLVTEKSLYSYSVGVSVFFQIFFLPVLGAIADYTHLKKTLLAFFCYLGAISVGLLFFAGEGHYFLAAFLFIVANLSAGASIVFFNSYLNDITTEDRRDQVSSWSFATGYTGGTLTLVFGLIFLLYSDSFGISKMAAVRICFLFAAVWWGGFAVLTFLNLKSRIPERSAPEGKHYIATGFSELWATLKELAKLRQTLRFLIGYLLYNDGIQTVIAMAALFLSEEVRGPDGSRLTEINLFVAFLIAQVVGILGALVFERIAHWTNSKTAILISLAIWCGIVIYGYGFLQTLTEAYCMSGAIGFVLGGSQALSRSLFSQMIPRGREAAFFGIYAISERGTSWIGPIVFGLVAQMTDSYRPAILALIFFFIIGSLILLVTDTAKAIHDAGNLLPDEAAEIS
jgi:UMF1 family MFS transporter